MNSKTIKLHSSSLHMFYRQYVELLNPLLSLSNRQLDTLAVLMYFNHDLSSQFSDPNNPMKWTALFSPKSRKEMCSLINMEKMNFNNNMKILRDKNIISYAGIREDIVIDHNIIDKEFVVNFKFNIKINKDEGDQNEVSEHGENV